MLRQLRNHVKCRFAPPFTLRIASLSTSMQKSPSQARASQVPALPPLLSPWQRQTSPNKAHLHPSGSTTNEVTPHFYRGTLSREGGSIDAERLEQLEARVVMLEQANRALLEEVVQIEARERSSRASNLERSWQKEVTRLSSEIRSQLDKLAERVALNERTIQHEELRVSTLVQSTQEIERGILDGQQQLLARREQQEVQLGRLRESVHQLEHSQLQMQELSRRSQTGIAEQVRRAEEELEELRTLENDLESGIQQQVQQLEQKDRALGEGLVQVDVAASKLENVNKQLKKQMDLRLSELRSGYTDLEDRMTHMESERRKQETWLRQSFSQIQAQIEWNSGHMQESVHSVAKELEKNAKNAAAENDRLLSRVISALQLSSRESSEARERLKEDLEEKIGAVEEAVDAERKAQESREVAMCSGLRGEWEGARDKLDGEVADLKTAVKEGRRGMAVLQGTVRVAEQEAKVARKELSSVLEAEIKIRRQELTEMQSQCNHFFEQSQNHLVSLQTSLDSMEERVISDREQMQSLREDLTCQWQEMGQRMLCDLDSRLSSLHQHIAQLEAAQAVREPQLRGDGEVRAVNGEGEEGDVEEGGVSRSSFYHEVMQWKREASQQLAFLQQQLADSSQVLAGLGSALEGLQVKLVGAVQRETNQRFHAVLELKNELSHLAARLPLLPPPRGEPVPHRHSFDHAYHGRYVPKHASLYQHHHTQAHQEQQRPGALPPQPLSQNRPMSRESFLSEEEEEEEEERSGKEEDDHSYDDGELLETMPEPQSVHYSVSEQYMPSHLHSKSRVLLLRTRLQQSQHSLEDTSNGGHLTPFPLSDKGEASGTFQSAVSTPISQQQVPQETGSGGEFSGQEDSSWEEDEVEGEGEEEEEGERDREEEEEEEGEGEGEEGEEKEAEEVEEPGEEGVEQGNGERQRNREEEEEEGGGSLEERNKEGEKRGEQISRAEHEKSHSFPSKQDDSSEAGMNSSECREHQTTENPTPEDCVDDKSQSGDMSRVSDHAAELQTLTSGEVGSLSDGGGEEERSEGGGVGEGGGGEEGGEGEEAEEGTHDDSDVVEWNIDGQN